MKTHPLYEDKEMFDLTSQKGWTILRNPLFLHFFEDVSFLFL